MRIRTIINTTTIEDTVQKKNYFLSGKRIANIFFFNIKWHSLINPRLKKKKQQQQHNYIFEVEIRASQNLFTLSSYLYVYKQQEPVRLSPHFGKKKTSNSASIRLDLRVCSMDIFILIAKLRPKLER